MKIVLLYGSAATVAWLFLTTFEYVCARILAPGFGLTVPAFAAFGWVTFFSICIFSAIGIFKEILS